MNGASDPTSSFKVGGSLGVDDPSYVPRQADQTLYDAIKAGEFCYVFNSRQMGKSSLRVQAVKRLQAEDVVCRVVDISAIGSYDIKASEWYLGFTRRVSRGIKRTVEVRQWWTQNEGISPVQRLGDFIEEVLLEAVSQPLVIFVDEIDGLLGLDFKDDFFAFLRSCYQRRASNAKFRKLTFVLLGVATPSNLIHDKTRTPFNIGRAIALEGFYLNEVAPLAAGLEHKADHPMESMRAILHWTGGQPFLTQKVCQLLVQSPFHLAAGSEDELVAQLVRSRIIENWEAQDEPPHLRTIQNRLLSNEQQIGHLLGTYQRILQAGEIPFDNSSAQTELRLSGLVAEQQGRLKVYNEIYKEVFTQEWVDQNLDNLRPYAEALAAWTASGFADESRLLRGQALEEAKQWAENKLLSDADNRFLAASQELATRDARRQAETERRRTESLVQANRIARRRVRNGSFIAAAVVAIAAIVGVFEILRTRNLVRATEQDLREKREELATTTQNLEQQQQQLSSAQQQLEQQRENLAIAKEREQQAIQRAAEAEQEAAEALDARTNALRLRDRAQQLAQQAQQAMQRAIADAQQAMQAAAQARREATLAQLASQEARQGNRLERESIEAIRQFDSQQLEALVQALYTGEELSSLVKDERPLQNYPTTAPILALNTILGDIHERLRLHHEDEVMDLSISPDGQMIATASRDSTATIWNLSGQPLAVLRGHQADITHIQFSPDGQYIVTASGRAADSTAQVWNLAGDRQAVLDAHQEGITQVGISPDSQRIITVSSIDGTAYLWHFSGEPIGSLDGGGFILDAVFTPDSRSVLTALADGTVKAWDSQGNSLDTFDHPGSFGIGYYGLHPEGGYVLVDADPANNANQYGIHLHEVTGERIATLMGHQSAVNRILFHPEDDFILTLSQDNTARLWNFEGIQQSVLSHSYSVENAAFNPEGDLLVTTTARDYSAHLWDWATNRKLSVLSGHEGAIRAIDFSPRSASDRYIVTASNDKTARVWDVSNQFSTVLSQHQNEVVESVYSPDGQYILTASVDDTARLWSAAGQPLLELEGHENDVLSAAYSPNGRLIATASKDKTVRLWNLNGQSTAVLTRHKDWINQVEFSPDGQQIVTASNDDTAILWTPQTNEQVVLSGHEGNINTAIFSPNGQLIVTASRDQTARIWDRHGQLVKVLSGHEAPIREAVFSPNSQVIVTVSNDDTARLWSVSGDTLAVLEGHQEDVVSAQFSPEGRYVVTTSGDGTARLWNLEGQLQTELDAHLGTVWAVHFSHDGQQIVTVAEDGTARLWDLEGRELAVFEGHEDAINDANFSPNGQQLITASADGTVRIWQIETLDELLVRGCDWLRDYLEYSTDASDRDKQLCQRIKNSPKK
jgi:WD40 repeat protein